MQAAIVLFREGGALLALPAISDEVLDSYAAMIDPGQEALVGPCCRVVCRLMDLDQDLDLDTQAEVLLVDMDFAQTETLLMDFQPAQEAHHEAVSFEEGLHHAIPIPSQVLGLARDWIAAQEQERLDYYTAQKEAVPVTPGGIPHLGTSLKGKPPGPKRAAPKRATVASLQNRVETLLGALPTLTQQLDRLAARQEAFEQNMAGAQPSVPIRPPSTGRAAAPVSSVLGQSPLTVPLLPSFASQIGPPPKTKSFKTSPAAHLRALPEDEPIDLKAEVDGRPLEVDPTQHPYAEALLQQSRALVSLVSHLSSASSDPMAELTGSSSGLGERCSRAREIATGACPAERPVLFEGVPSNSPQTESYDSSSRQPRECGQHKPYDLLGTVWRLWCTPRTGSGDVERSIA